MTDRKYYLWLIPGVLVLGMALALVLTFQPVFAGSAQEVQQSADSSKRSAGSPSRG